MSKKQQLKKLTDAKNDVVVQLMALDLDPKSQKYTALRAELDVYRAKIASLDGKNSAEKRALELERMKKKGRKPAKKAK